MSALPTTPTFLFTDIAGSTRLWAEQRGAMGAALARHDALLRAAVAEAGGTVFKTVGDAVYAVFSSATDAVAAAVAGQRALAAEDWAAFGEGFPRLSVRMALHTGLAESCDGDWFGQPLNRVARLLATGHGGQVLVSRATEELVADHLPEGLGLRDLGEHRLKDLARGERVYQLVGADLPADFPALRSADARPNNLPLLPHPLLGREQELAELVALLTAGDSRLVTLTGPGGTGKTRLALAAAADALDHFGDGVYFVDLSPLIDTRLLPAAIAGSLGLVETPGEAVASTLCKWLEPRQLLLLLDNFEQLLAAAPQLTGLLAACPRLRILVTSRAPLRSAWEHELPLAPLPVPDPSVDGTLAAISRYAAVQLFVNRATAVRPDFQVTAASAAAIAQLVARLDGLPLAIELAAARVRVMPPQAILERLDQRLRLLVGGPRDRPERQQTLRAAVAWSYDLLDPSHRRLFRGLAVFAGGCTLDAAEAVAGVPAELDLWEALPALVEQSLLVMVDDAGEPRYRLLETLRAFGLERLAEAGEEAEVRDRHLAWCAALAAAAAPDLEGPKQPEWLARLDADLDNIRAALDWSLRSGQSGRGLGLAADLLHFWYQRSRTAEARQTLEALLAAAPEQAPASVQARAWRALGAIAMYQGAVAEAGRCFTAAREAAEGDDGELARCLVQSAWQAWAAGDGLRAGTLWQEAFAAAQERGRSLGLDAALALGLRVAGGNRADPGAADRPSAFGDVA